jgi:DNA-binding CsgD family transcriptional regulator
MTKTAARKTKIRSVRSSIRPSKDLLTARETQVVRLLSLGCSIYEVAAILKLASATIDNFKTSAMRKLGTNKAALLTRAAIQTRISSLSDSLTPAEKRRMKLAQLRT